MSKWVNPHSGTPLITIMTSLYCPLFIPDNRCSCLCYAIGIKTHDDLFGIPSQWNFQYTVVKFQLHCSGRKIGLKYPIFCSKENLVLSEGNSIFFRRKILFSSDKISGLPEWDRSDLQGYVRRCSRSFVNGCRRSKEGNKTAPKDRVILWGGIGRDRQSIISPGG